MTVDGLDAESAIAVMIDFYLGTRAEDVDVEADGDMLLFQWSARDHFVDGRGQVYKDAPLFEYNITRQFIGASCEDDAFLQLSLTLYYEVEGTIDGAPERGNRWCHRPVEERSTPVWSSVGDIAVGTFREFIRFSAAREYVATRELRRVELELGGV